MPGKLKSPESLNHARDHTARLRPLTFCRSPTPTSHRCFIQATNKCSATIHITKERFIRCKPEPLLPSAIGSRTVWSFATANHCHLSPIYNYARGLVYEPDNEAECFAFYFVRNSTSFNYLALLASSSSVVSLFLPIVGTRKFR